MKIHTDTITHYDVRDARILAHVDTERQEQVGSRTRDHAFNITLSGSSTRRGNMGAEHMAATWDEWGIFLGHLFEIDPLMHCWAYMGRGDYDHQTGDRFTGPDALTWANQCPNHKWSGAYQDGEFYTHECIKMCGAHRSWRRLGHRVKATRGGFSAEGQITRTRAEEILAS